MPSVPFSGVPEVAPAGPGAVTPRLSINAPAAAFGGDVAAATSHLGEAISGAGNELFARGMAMQDLYNHSVANQAVADYQETSGKLHAEFSSLQGKDAVDAFPKYIDDLKASRKATQDALPNPMAQKMFESASLSVQGRTIFNGAGHAASQNKSYAIGASAARVQTAQNAALQNPNDEEGFQAELQTTIDETRAQWGPGGKGADPDTVDNAVRNEVSNTYAKRIQGLLKTQPFAAQKVFDQAVKDGKISGDKLGPLTNMVQAATHSVGARNISHDINSGSDLSPGSTVVDIKQAQNAIGTYESTNNYTSKGPEVFSKDGTSRGRALGRYQVMPENLQPWLKEAGLPAMSQAEFLASPSAQDQVFNSKFGSYMDKYGSFNNAAQAWFAGEGSIGKDVSNVHDNANGRPGHTVPQYLQGTNAVLAKNMPLSDKVNAGVARARELSPDDPLLEDYTQQRIIADHNQVQSVQRAEENENKNTIESALVGGTGPDAKIPTSVEELTADPQAASAWQRMVATKPADARKYLGIMAKNAKGDVAMTEPRLRQYQQIKGEAATDPAAFLERDVISADLPMSVRKELVNLQGKLSKDAQSDPRVSKALTVLQPQLQAAGIDKTKANKEDYYQFVGSLQDRLADYQNENKKAPDAETVQKIGSQLLQEQITSKGFLWDSKSPLFKVPVPEEESGKIKEFLTSKNGIAPSDDAVQRFYTSLQYNKLYGKKKATP